MEKPKKTFFKFIFLKWTNVVLFIMGNLIPLTAIYYAINIMLKDETKNPIVIIILCVLWIIGYYFRIYNDYKAYKKSN